MRLRKGTIATVLFLSAGTASASPLATPVRHERLANGLRVVLAADHTLPCVAVCVAYDVGSRHEARGRAGFAHLLEHLMFQGSAHVAAGAHHALLVARGAEDRASTTADATTYCDLVPETDLALALWLEADRMKSLAITAGALDAQRAVVVGELRSAVSMQPYVLGQQKLGSLVYGPYWPYAHDPMQPSPDVAGATLASVLAFHAAYYGPNEAALAVAGDFDPDAAASAVGRYFGDARPATTPADAPADASETPVSTATIEDARAAFAALFYGWRIPARGDPDHAALEVAAALLAHGDSSRLSRALVREQALASALRAQALRHRGPDLLELAIDLEPTASIDRVESLVTSELASLARVGPSSGELALALASLADRDAAELDAYDARAERLAEIELAGEEDAPRAVTKEDVRRVVTKYLGEAGRSRVLVTPPVRKPATGATTSPNRAPSQ
jgi:zinc protease